MFNDDKNVEKFSIEETKNDPFAKILPEPVAKLSGNANRISVSKDNQKFVTLSTKSIFAEYIFKAIYYGKLSDWFIGLSNTRHYLRHTKDFVNYLNSYKFDDANRYNILKDFESFKVNEEGLKPQSTGLSNLLSLIKNGISHHSFTNSQTLYLATLINITKPSKYGDRIPHTLNHWFNIGWLKTYVGEETFLLLESPKLLIESFKVTIATTLSYLIEAKKELREKIENSNISIEKLCSGENEYSNLPPLKKCKYSQNLFQSMANFQGVQPLDKSTQCMLIDLVNQVRFHRVLEKIEAKGIQNVPFMFYSKKNKKINFTKSILFTPQYLYSPSPLEELLFGWLIATLMVQPEDIAKLKKTNFNFEKNSQGKVILVQCNYYKGRAGGYKEPPLLDNSNIELKTFVDYFSILPSDRKYLFSDKRLQTPRMVTPYIEGTAQPSMIAFLFKLLESKGLYELIKANSIKKQVCNVFYKSFLGLNLSTSISYDTWRKNTKKTREEYVAEVDEPLPINIFRPAHIKTSVVYSGSDLYREGDLVNYNSHTSNTEKLSYLTDSNKEWVNQCGRISRLVLNEIENNIYKPNVEAVDFYANEKILKTQILKATGCKSAKINMLGQHEQANIENFDDSGKVMVIDSTETAVNMLHYIQQADTFSQELLVNNPKFFEQTLLVNVEWMHHVLEKLTITTVKKAHDFYSKNFKQFPNIFEDELRGGVTS